MISELKLQLADMESYAYEVGSRLNTTVLTYASCSIISCIVAL